MKKLLIPLAAFITLTPIQFTLSQTSSSAPITAIATPSQPAETKGSAKAHKPAQQTETTTSAINATPTWTSEVYFPLIRLTGIAIILGVLLWWIDLPELMKAETWTDRTVIALIIIFSFAAATLINVSEKALTALKDITLIVIGFYFGAARSGGASGKAGAAAGGQQKQPNSGQGQQANPQSP